MTAAAAEDALNYVEDAITYLADALAVLKVAEEPSRDVAAALDAAKAAERYLRGVVYGEDGGNV